LSVTGCAVLLALLLTASSAAAAPPAGVVVLKDRCHHDSPQLSSGSATPLIAQQATQSYSGTTRSAMRFVVSSLDLTTSGRYCQAVNNTVPDFISTTAGSNVTCATSDAVLTDAKRTVLLSRVVPLALQWLTARLAVVPVNGNLALNTQGCGLYTMPTGAVSGADTLVLVSAAPVASPLNASEWVRGAVCQYDQNGRPTVIVLNVAPDVISASVGAASSSCAAELGSYGNAAEQSLARSVAHALVHGLGFSYRFMTTRLTSIPLSSSTRRGKAVQLVTSPAASGAAQAHFGCSSGSLAGVELEDQGLENVTRSSHWEARNHGQDLMSAESKIWVVRDTALADQCLTEPSDVRMQRRFTNVTLGLLKDFGFYTVAADAVEETTFGKNLGCAFLNETCNRTASNALWSSTYCNQAGNPAAGHWCAADRREVANCPTSVYSQSLPGSFRYFADVALGGTQDLADYCPMPAPVFRCAGTASRDTASLTPLSRVLSVSGVAASRCVTYMDLSTTPVAGSPLWDGAVCANMRCVKDAETAQLTVQLQLQNTFGSDEWATCENANNNTNFVTVRYNSSTAVMIGCPPAWEVCGSLPQTNSSNTTNPNSTAPVPSTPAPVTAAPQATAQVTVRFSGNGWGLVLSRNRTQLEIVVIRLIKNATGLFFVVIVNMREGSLVVDFTSNDPGASSTTVASSMLAANVSSLGTLYQDVTGLPASSVTVASASATETPRSSDPACNDTCIILICVLGGVAVLAIVGFIVFKLCRKPDPEAPPQK